MVRIDDLVKDFIVESHEALDALDRDFISLETNAEPQEQLGAIFRIIHTIKGNCGCLGLPKLEGVAHVGENLLARLRDGDLRVDAEITNALLRLVDAVREILASIEADGKEGTKDFSEIKAELTLLNERPSVRAGSSPAAEEDSPAAAPTPAPSITAAPEPAATVAAAPAPTPATPPSSPASVTASVLAPATSSPKAAAIDASVEAPAEPTHPVDSPHAKNDSMAANAIRVDVGLLDKLMNLVGELVLARNQVLQFTTAQKDGAFIRTAQRLNLITTELQEGVMKTRMQPIGNLWNKFPRVVHDVASSCQKKVRLEMEGHNTELDKTILEAIKDPLTHIIRNSIDHGVETPEMRRQLGKPEEGRVFMRAFHEGGQVNIEISDDGKGIDAEAVRRKAVERGLVTPDAASRMGDREAINLCFLPGFSTADKVTNVSGRGVGMDVVKTNVERIGGMVDVKSDIGKGTTIRIKIPLTLAIIPALVVTSAGERFAIPQVSLLELVRIDENDSGIEMIKDTPIYRLRGTLLPLVYLNKELKLERTATDGTEKAIRSENIVVLRGGERQFGLVVDQINDTEEIVVKPLGKQLNGLSVFAGATIMGDGKVALILDVMGLAQRANVISQAGDGSVRAGVEHAKTEAADRQTLLLCTLIGGQRAAIPLSLVARLEEFSPSNVEDAGGQPVVQYRDQIMPLINVADVIRGSAATLTRDVKEANSSDTIQVVVYTHEDRTIGLRVDRIVDVVEERVLVQRTATRPGVLGTAIIKEKVTEMLDVAAVVRSALSFQTAIRSEAA